MDEPPARPPSTLRAALHFFEEAILLTQYHAHGSTTYPVAASDVVTTLGQLPTSTGLLPQNTLFHQTSAGQLCLGVYVPARRWQVQEGTSRLLVPLPPLMLVGWGTRYWIYALKAYPTTPRATLFHAPLPNVHARGALCAGNTPLPSCTPATIHEALQLILEGSAFNGHLVGQKCRRYPQDVRALWRDLATKRRFPLSQLLPSAVTFSQWLEGRFEP